MQLTEDPIRFRPCRSRYIYVPLCLLAVLGVLLSGCKSQPITKVKTPGTNIVAVMPPGSAFITTSNPVAVTVANPISINITNTPVRLPEHPISLVITGASFLQISNHVDVTASLISTNPGAGRTKPADDANKTAENKCSIICKLLDILDHHFTEIIGLAASLISLIAGKAFPGLRGPNKPSGLWPRFKRFITDERLCYAISAGALLVVLLALGLRLFGGAHGNSGPSGAAAANSGQQWAAQFSGLSNKLDEQQKSLEQLNIILSQKQYGGGTNHFIVCQPPPAPGRFPVEIVVALVTAFPTIGFYFFRKWREEHSINIAISAEIERLYEVICRHQEWRERCKEEEKSQKIAGAASTDDPEPLIPFAYPVYTKHVENIGVLSKKLVAKAVTFYGWVDYLNRFQGLRKDYLQNNALKLFNQRYDGMLKKFKDEFKEPFGKDFKPFKPNDVAKSEANNI